MARTKRYAGIGALGGALIGSGATLLAWRALTATDRPPAFLLETMAFFLAPPFGLGLSYLVAAVTGLSGMGLLLWAWLTPTLNWALVGLLLGAIRDIRASNAAWRASRPSV